MLKLEGNIIIFDDGVPFATILYKDNGIVLQVNECPLKPTEITELITILKTIDGSLNSQKSIKSIIYPNKKTV